MRHYTRDEKFKAVQLYIKSRRCGHFLGLAEPMEKTHFFIVCFCMFFLTFIKQLVNSVIQTAFTSRFRFNAVADKRHISIK